MTSSPGTLAHREPFARSYLLLLALLYTCLNAPKPLLIDDTAYHFYARHLAEQPLDPYQFEAFWYQHPEPAQAILVPPLLPYWWSVAIRLFGEQPVLWKAWLLPFSLLLVWSLGALFRRFAGGLETPLVWLTVLSPTFLPSLNLMLDVPALALSLGALAVFLRACDRGSLSLAALAGLVAGLAIETKYTGFLAPAAILLYAALCGRLRLGLVAAVVAGQVFMSWEFLTALLYGDSHFLYHAREGTGRLKDKLYLILPLGTLCGGVAPATALLALLALRWRRRTVLLAGSAVVLGYVLVAAVPDAYGIFVPGPGVSGAKLTLAQLIYGAFGAAFWTGTAVVIRRLLAEPLQARLTWFLVGWLGLEVAGYFALSPFPAVRRVLGVVVVATLLAGRLAAVTCRSRPEVWWVRGVALGGVLLGLVFYGVDLRDAFAEKEAAEAAARYIREQEPSAAIWYVGHWGFQYYAERAGMRAVAPDRSRLRPGDWLVVPDERLNQQEIQLDERRTVLAGTVSVQDPVPLRTVSCFYGGRTPLEHHEGPRVVVALYRVTEDCIPASKE
jgi:hypothetical protein